MFFVPNTASTHGAFCAILLRSSWAMHPPIAICMFGCVRLRSAHRPMVPYMRSAAFSRTAHVFMTIRSTSLSAACSSVAGMYPSSSSTPAIRSESCTFIWHPSVCT